MPSTTPPPDFNDPINDFLSDLAGQISSPSPVPCIPLSRFLEYVHYNEIRALIELIKNRDELFKAAIQAIEDRLEQSKRHMERVIDMLRDDIEFNRDLFLRGGIFDAIEAWVKDEWKQYVQEILDLFDAWNQTYYEYVSLAWSLFTGILDGLLSLVDNTVDEIANVLEALLDLLPDPALLEQIIRDAVRKILPTIC